MNEIATVGCLTVLRCQFRFVAFVDDNMQLSLPERANIHCIYNVHVNGLRGTTYMYFVRTYVRHTFDDE